jgi:hypothetical protein
MLKKLLDYIPLWPIIVTVGLFALMPFEEANSISPQARAGDKINIVWALKN